MTYKTIYADPPWFERGGGKMVRGANRHYDLMKTPAIMEMKVPELVDPVGCHLYLWVTNSFLRDGFKVMEAWGFRYINMITWVKDQMGIGQYYRGGTEQLLFGVSGRLPYKVDDQGKRMQAPTVIFEPAGPHSVKPSRARVVIEKVSYGPRVELFARRNYAGWDSWGNQVPECAPLQLL